MHGPMQTGMKTNGTLTNEPHGAVERSNHVSNTRFQRVQELFLQALELSASELQFWIDTQCGGDEKLKEEVLALIAAAGKDDDPLERGLEAVHNSSETRAESQPRLHDLLVGDSSSPSERIPSIIGNYLIIRELGRGGMGVVYEAKHASLDRRVALKILPHAFGSDASRERFRREARAAAKLHHSNIVPVFDFGEDDDMPYYVMQKIEGRGLDDVIRWAREKDDAQSPECRLANFWLDQLPQATRQDSDDTPRVEATQTVQSQDESPWNYIARLGIQAAEGLHYAHSLGIVHRDIKPSNLLLDRNHHLWITDFGLAKTAEDPDLTNTGDIIGTLRYIPPEAIGGKGGERGDIYGLGLVLYELIARTRPFGDETPASLINHITEHGPAPIQRACPRVPPNLASIVQKAIHRDPAMRYASADAMSQDLQRFTQGKPILARRASWFAHAWSWSKRNRIAAALLTTLIIFITGGFVASTMISMRLNRLVHERNMQLFESKLNEARSVRKGGVQGQRFLGIQAIEEAMELHPASKVDEATKLRLRNELIGALALTDLTPRDEWPPEVVGQYAFAYHDDAKRVAVSDNRAGRAILFDADSKQIVAQSPKSTYTTDLNLSPNGRWLGWVDASKGELVVHDLQIANPELGPATQALRRKVARSSSIMCYGFDAEHRIAYYDRQLTSIVVFDLQAQEELWRFPTTSSVRPHVCLSRDGTKIAVRSFGGSPSQQFFQVLEMGTGRSLMRVDEVVVSGIAFNADGSEISIAHNFWIDVYDIASKQRRFRLPDNQSTKFVAYTREGDVLVSSGWGPFTTFWSAAHGKQLLRVPGNFMPYGSYLTDQGHIAIHEGDRLTIHQYASGSERRKVFRGREHAQWNTPEGVTIHPDGRIVVMISTTGLRIGDAVAGRDLGEMFLGPIGQASFTHDGSHLITFGLGAYAWPVRIDRDTVHVGPPSAIDPKSLGGFVDAEGELIVYHAGKLFEPRTKFFVVGPDLRQRPEPLECPPQVNVIASHLSSGLIAFRFVTGLTVIYDLNEKSKIEEFPDGTSVSFSADGKLAVISSPNASTLYSLEQRRVTHQSRGVIASATISQGQMIYPLAQPAAGLNFSKLASGQTLAFLPAETGALPRNLGGKISQDQRFIATFSQFDELDVWDLSAVRKQLRPYGLDWSSTALRAPTRDHTAISRRLKLEIDWGGRRRRFLRTGLQAYVSNRGQPPYLAIQCIDERLRQSPQDIDLLIERARFHLWLKNLPAAARDIKAALALSPRDPEVATLSKSLSKEGWKQGKLFRLLQVAIEPPSNEADD